VLLHVVLDELQQDWSHLLALHGGSSFKSVVQLDVDVDVQAFGLLVLFGRQALRSSTPQPPEYYWLCPTCSTAMTLHINAQRTVVTAPLPVGIQGCCPDVEPMLVRQEGLLLRNVRCRSREPNEDRMADRPKEAHHAS